MNRLKRKPSALDARIEELLESLHDNLHNPTQYEATLTSMERLYKLKAQKASQRLSPDTALTVAANLLGIAVIVRHEQFNVITSKAMSFAIKPK